MKHSEIVVPGPTQVGEVPGKAGGHDFVLAMGIYREEHARLARLIAANDVIPRCRCGSTRWVLIQHDVTQMIIACGDCHG